MHVCLQPSPHFTHADTEYRSDGVRNVCTVCPQALDAGAVHACSDVSYSQFDRTDRIWCAAEVNASAWVVTGPCRLIG